MTEGEKRRLDERLLDLIDELTADENCVTLHRGPAVGHTNERFFARVQHTLWGHREYSGDSWVECLEAALIDRNMKIVFDYPLWPRNELVALPGYTLEIHNERGMYLGPRPIPSLPAPDSACRTEATPRPD